LEGDELQLRKTKLLKFEEDGLFDEKRHWNSERLEGFCGNLNELVIPTRKGITIPLIF
jgi:hypothetical protein